MKIGSFDTTNRTFIVAEVGNNHEGSFALAEDMVGCAAEAGADAVKFQTFRPEHYVSAADPARLARLKGFQLTYAQFDSLAQTAKKAGIVFFSTPFDLESARFLNTIQPLFKIASGDNTFFPLLETVAGFGKPMIVSTGLADLPLLDRVHQTVRKVWSGQDGDPGLAFLHCIASYPAPPSQANLGAIAALAKHFPGCTIGYSDHTMGITAATYAVVTGARIVEKHFTIDKNYSDFRDHQLSADPEDMRRLVTAIREAEEMLGSGEKTPQACEEELRSAVRRSIAAGRDLAAGTVLGMSDLTWVRPGSGLAPGSEAQLLGRAVNRNLKLGELILAEDLAAG